MNPGKINRISVLLLVIGFGTALVIYLTAQPVILDPLLGDPMDSKRYVHDMQVIGGKGNVLAAEFMDWFAGLWRGQSLAGTVAVLTVGVTLAFRFVASHPDYASGASSAKDKPPPPPGHSGTLPRA